MATTKKKKTTSKTTKAAPMRSFALYKSKEPFMTFRITQQTVYWLVIGLLVLSLGIWLTFLSIKIQRVYDQVELQSSLQSHSPARQ